MTENKLSIEKLKNLQWKIMQDVSASALIPLMRIGDELGLFIVLGKQGPCTESEFSNFAKIDQRYAKEWLNVNDFDISSFCPAPIQFRIRHKDKIKRE